MRSKRVSKFRTKYLKKNTRKKSKTRSKRLKKNKVKRSKRSVSKGGSSSSVTNLKQLWETKSPEAIRLETEIAEAERLEIKRAKKDRAEKLDKILEILNTEYTKNKSKTCEADVVCKYSVGERKCHTTSELCRIFGDCRNQSSFGDEDDCSFYETNLNIENLYSFIQFDPRKSKINSFIDKRINRLWEESLNNIKETDPREYCLGIILLTPEFSEKIIDYLKNLESIDPRIKTVLEETLKSGKSPNEIIKFLFEKYNSVDYSVIFNEMVKYLRKYTKERNNNFIDIINDSADHIASMILNAPSLTYDLRNATYNKY